MFAYCNNNPVLCFDPEGTRLMLAYNIGGGSVWHELYGNWRYRIDPAKTSTKTKRHIHIQNTRTKEEYIQNDEGSSHDKKSGKKGKLPRKLQEALKEKAGWDYNGKRKNFYDGTFVSARDDGMLYVYADGVQVIAPYTLHFSNTSTLESYYYGYGAQELFDIPIGMPFVEGTWANPLPMWGWYSTPLVPAF